MPFKITVTRNNDVKYGVVLLAAGRSERMGRPKLLLPWAGTSILGHQLHLWQLLSAYQVAVVCARADKRLRDELHRLGFPAGNQIHNPHPDLGMYSSIRCAARWQGWDDAVTHFVIALGDQPHLRLEALQVLLSFSAAHPDRVCQPRQRSRLYHPVILPRRLFRELAATSIHRLDEYLKRIPEEVAGCDIDDAGFELDIDTVQDYEQAVHEYLKAGQSGDETGATPPI